MAARAKVPPTTSPPKETIVPYKFVVQPIFMKKLGDDPVGELVGEPLVLFGAKELTLFAKKIAENKIDVRENTNGANPSS